MDATSGSAGNGGQSQTQNMQTADVSARFQEWLMVEIANTLCVPARNTWVRVGQQRGDGQQDFRYCECWTPVVLQHIQTNVARRRDVAVVDTGLERHLHKTVTQTYTFSQRAWLTAGQPLRQLEKRVQQTVKGGLRQ
jgi:hypothetical protein